MGQVLQFNPKEQSGAGAAFCIACSHDWVAVAPTGTIEMECPKCKSMKGRWKFAFAPVDLLVSTCDCGNQLYYMTQEGHMCANCGIYRRY